jgi:hypothetical protein
MKKYIVILILLFIMIYALNTNNEEFTQDIIFMKKEETSNFLIADQDGYHKTFNVNDLFARNINKVSDYADKIKNTAVDFTEKQKKKITNSIRQIKLLFNHINYNYFEGRKANKIPWSIGLMSGVQYENGLPHTRHHKIILFREYINTCTENELIKLLIHEMIHVYQKMYPSDVKIYLNINKYSKFAKRNTIMNSRANPDLDEWIYKDYNDVPYYSRYNHMPKNISDVTYYPNNTSSSEHPFEKMAYDLSNEMVAKL